MYRKWDAFVSSLSDSEEEEIILKAKQAHRQALIQMTVSREPSKPFRYGIGDFKDPKGVINLKQYYYEDYTEVAKVFVDLKSQFTVSISELKVSSSICTGEMENCDTALLYLN